jgi:hypothetical protein
MLDYTLLDPDLFFVARKRSRDCDDWANLWYLWGKHHGHMISQVYCRDKTKDPKAHMTCIGLWGKKYYLLDYTFSEGVDSLEEALENLRLKYNYDKDTFTVIKYKGNLNVELHKTARPE